MPLWLSVSVFFFSLGIKLVCSSVLIEIGCRIGYAQRIVCYASEQILVFLGRSVCVLSLCLVDPYLRVFSWVRVWPIWWFFSYKFRSRQQLLGVCSRVAPCLANLFGSVVMSGYWAKCPSDGFLGLCVHTCA